jgi:hypothetical protein
MEQIEMDFYNNNFITILGSLLFANSTTSNLKSEVQNLKS